jgi:hypothetical protein
MDALYLALAIQRVSCIVGCRAQESGNLSARFVLSSPFLTFVIFSLATEAYHLCVV